MEHTGSRLAPRDWGFCSGGGVLHCAKTRLESRRRGTAASPAVTLIELLCVLAIICILASMLLPTVARVYERVRGMAEEVEADEIAYMLRHATRNYCEATPQYIFQSKKELADKCGLVLKCKDWVQAPLTEFVPFDFQTDTNKIVVTWHIGRKHATIYRFSKGELSIRPER
jgi:prepilin-type N-terminal cleavage/methylation domain-containing protein